MINPMDLTGKLVLVTGASSGIGKETAIQISRLGARVVLVARRVEQLEETSKLMEGNSHKFYSFDLSKVETIEAFIKNVVSENGQFNGFVHCAGISPMRPLSMTKYENIITAMNVNFFAFVEIIRCITKKGCFYDGGSIVGISSVSSIKGNKSKLSYCASKAAMDAAIRCIAFELKDKKIKINSIMPGWVSTEMYEYYKDNFNNTNESNERLKRQFLGVSKPVEIANLVAFLLSDATNTITGTSVLIDGGGLQG